MRLLVKITLLNFLHVLDKRTNYLKLFFILEKHPNQIFILFLKKNHTHEYTQKAIYNKLNLNKAALCYLLQKAAIKIDLILALLINIRRSWKLFLFSSEKEK